MARPFYARYVPPKPSVQTKSQKALSVTEEQVETYVNTQAQANLPRKRKRRDKDEHSRKEINSTEAQAGRLTFHSITAGPRRQKVSAGDPGPEDAAPGTKPKRPTSFAEQAHGNGSTANHKTENKRGKKIEDTLERENAAEPSLGHSKILSRFEKAVKSRFLEQGENREKTEHHPFETPELHDLVPIPFPDAPAQLQPQNASSMLPGWLSRPVSVAAEIRASFEELQIDHEIRANLRQKGFINALPVQSGVLPLLLPLPTQHPGDICVSAATGSGKTLAYVLPVVQSLITHMTTSLRALIIVPTRELVDQVRDTAEICCSGTRLHVGSAVGTQRFETEQAMLIDKARRYDPVGYMEMRERLERNMSYHEVDVDSDGNTELDSADALLNLLPNHIPFYSSKVDILITTPGRLVDHIKSTPGFTLSNLEWLVIDEADRLLDESFQEWVSTLTAATDPLQWRGPSPLLQAVRNTLEKKWRPRKVVLSATMTRDLDKLSRLHLKNPKMVVIEPTEEQSKITQAREDKGTEIPLTLEEYGIPVGDGSDKPLYLMGLLVQILGGSGPAKQDQNISFQVAKALTGEDDTHASGADDSDHVSSSDVDNDQNSRSSSPSPFRDSTETLPANALIFTSKNESAHRLSRLLVHLDPGYKGRISTLTKSSTSRSTLKALSSFRSSKFRILIATDRASRGLDLPNLLNVINYDIPHSVTSYVHRVGRTARAGGQGRAWTLVEDRQAAFFWRDVVRGGGIDRAGRTVAKKKMDLKSLGEGAREKYQKALQELEKDVRGATQ